MAFNYSFFELNEGLAARISREEILVIAKKAKGRLAAKGETATALYPIARDLRIFIALKKISADDLVDIFEFSDKKKLASALQSAEKKYDRIFLKRLQEYIQKGYLGKIARDNDISDESSDVVEFIARRMIAKEIFELVNQNEIYG